MDTKKLIGTVIGVTLFAVLIAGATFAWLSFGTTVVDNSYVGNSVQFIVDYTKGSDITYMPMLDSTQVVPEDTRSLVVVAKKNSTSADGHLSIKLTTTSSDALTTSGAVRWAICRAAECTDDFSDALNSGEVTAAGTITLLNDAMLAEGGKTCSSMDTKTKQDSSKIDGQTCSTISATGGSDASSYLIGNGNTTDSISYYVYFWFDGYTLVDAHKNKTYNGYITASATQLES